MAIELGTLNSEILTGTDNADIFIGLAGNDRVFARFGDDQILAGSGDDKVFGGRGEDQLTGDAGNDTLSGGLGDDSLLGGLGNDIMSGNLGNDTLSGGLGDDTYTVSPSTLDIDIFVENFEEGIDTIILESPGNFTMPNNIENIFTVGGDGVQHGVIGNLLDNVITSVDGRDLIFGRFGNDTIIGGTGDEIISGDEGNDVLDGGANNDKYMYSTPFAFNNGSLGDITDSFGVDTILSFTPNFADPLSFDQIVLDKTTFTALTSDIGQGFSVATEFENLDDTLAAGSAAFIVYNPISGNVFYNENGAAEGFGTGGHFATIAQDPNNVRSVDFGIQA